MDLSSIQRRFILHWGEMGTRWGINRTVAQVHALLYIAPRALNAEEIAETLSVARSNVSTSLRELQGWGIVKVVHQLGDRRDYFETLTDVWEMYQIIMDERKRREIDPSVELLRQLVAESRDKAAEKHVHDRLAALVDYFQLMSTWYGQMRQLPRSTLLKFAKMGSKIASLLGLGRSKE